MKYNLVLLIGMVFFLNTVNAQDENKKPIRLAVVGMSHGHIPFILKRPNKRDFNLVGFYETNDSLIFKLSEQFNLNSKLIYKDLEKMLDEVKPEAVVAFGSVYDHLMAVEACAPRGIHVMVEKPLAVNMEHAKKMALLAKKHNIHLLTDYETSWYPSLAKSFSLVLEENFVGQLKRVIINTGHKGPKEIGCDKYFLEWLTDPKLNGGGAIVDFGCYGANIVTALTKGEKPISVSAVTRQLKPKVYPNVDDDATIVISYPSFQCVIQASWNWTFSRKDIEIYGKEGYIKLDKNQITTRKSENQSEETKSIKEINVDNYTDPFTYFGDVINKNIKMEPFSLYSIDNNIRVVEILDLARKSAQEGKAIPFK
ncbi:oxidoreductase [Polaribacter filamentus]|uniref:Oxidoreductase n=1 Tax=Polaribacter filamentus TaxID=53483 RepID=A0A2S7KYG5_9FLAO|nr:Gfo/Idh/MocA family oxidoreductase [Polaribacter filamentus]PQB07712.1 oxidoreductase [Polaribacter filamentus]